MYVREGATAMAGDRDEEMEALQTMVDRLIARCAAKDGEFALERAGLKRRIAGLEKDLKEARRAATVSG